ncbi:hypothetical protein N9949_01760 [Akkermansiaceae bacterium]|nr:hypothetical protein [Akkermansiaceae bacterium]MDB4300560.1 hypothetical protein [bacterium]MDB4308549.1 hypothetical protein [bacterium]MDB4323378.1 hypothetical protein [Akkermansiaceae bacterium]MDB4377972.1 hypothetical protein [Akkermansiaceae bacterium]
MIEETFFLYPPDWLKNPPNPPATKLFKAYAANAPSGTFPEQTSTHQGLYCMTADGLYLSGEFASQSRELAQRTLAGGLTRWGRMVDEMGFQPKPIPTNKIEIYEGEELRKGGIKLEVVYRDLPRGKVQRPGDSQFINPYNLGWYDLTPAEAKSFLTESREKVAIPDAIFQKLAHARLKDAVRGQMVDWNEGAIQKGQLFTQLGETQGSKKIYQLSGSLELSESGRTFSPSFHGSATYDTATGEFTDFRLIAAGQRSGKAGANGRDIDLGPAPMAVALTLYKP